MFSPTCLCVSILLPLFASLLNANFLMHVCFMSKLDITHFRYRPSSNPTFHTHAHFSLIWPRLDHCQILIMPLKGNYIILLLWNFVSLQDFVELIHNYLTTGECIVWTLVFLFLRSWKPSAWSCFYLEILLFNQTDIFEHF